MRHAFRLENTSDEPVQILRAINNKSCCGEIRIEPGTLQPGETTMLEVTLRLAELGPIVHLATVETDRPGAERLEFRTIATAYPRARIESASGSSIALLPSETKRIEFLALAYGTADEPPVSLEDSVLVSDLPLSWEGPTEERAIDDGLTERSRRFKATLTADGRPGPRAEEIRLLDSEEIISRHLARWEIVAAVQATPPGVVVPPSIETFERQVLIRYRDGQPFRIIEISADLPGVEIDRNDEAPKPLHTVRLTIRPEPANLGKAGTVSLTTDHPIQPLVEVAVFIGGGSAEVSATATEESP